MTWSNHAAAVLIIIGALAITAGGAAAFAILVQILRHGGWKLAEPAIRKARWQMVRSWLLVGAGVGLLYGIGVVVLVRSNQTPPAAPQDVIITTPSDVKPRPRVDRPPTE